MKRKTKNYLDRQHHVLVSRTIDAITRRRKTAEKIGSERKVLQLYDTVENRQYISACSKPNVNGRFSHNIPSRASAGEQERLFI